jgi:small-conductance mechanosensitive channel
MPKLSSRILSLTVLALGGSVVVFSQTSEVSGGGKDADNDVRLADVVIDGETLFSVRGVTAHPAERRAEQIEDRIRALAADPKISPTSLIIEDHPGGTWIMAGGQRIMAVLDKDAAVEEIGRGPLAELYKARIANAIEGYRQYRRPGFLWLHAFYVGGATVGLLVAAFLGRRMVVLLRAGFERRYMSRIERLEGRAHHIVKVEQIWRVLTGLLNALWAVGIAVMAYAYLNYILALFPWTRGFAKSLFAIAIDPLRTISLGLVGIIPNLVFLTMFALVIRYALKVIGGLFNRVADGTLILNGFDREWASPTYRLVRLVVIVFGLVVAYPHIPGSESGAFKGISLFVGIIFSLGSSSFIGNLIAGYSMAYRRAFKVGDRVKIGEQMGDVEQIRLMVTHLRTIKNEEVIVPNSTILGSEVINYSSMARERGLILHTTLGIRYETPWRQVEAMLLEAAARTPGLRRDPPPFVFIKNLGEFYITYEINVYCDAPQKIVLLYTELHANILDIFNEHAVQIMAPAYEGDTDQPKVVAKEQWYAAPASPPQIAVTTARQETHGASVENTHELMRT